MAACDFRLRDLVSKGSVGESKLGSADFSFKVHHDLICNSAQFHLSHLRTESPLNNSNRSNGGVSSRHVCHAGKTGVFDFGMDVAK